MSERVGNPPDVSSGVVRGDRGVLRIAGGLPQSVGDVGLPVERVVLVPGGQLERVGQRGEIAGGVVGVRRLGGGQRSAGVGIGEGLLGEPIHLVELVARGASERVGHGHDVAHGVVRGGRGVGPIRGRRTQGIGYTRRAPQLVVQVPRRVAARIGDAV